MQKDLETRSFEVTRAALQAKRALIQGTNEQADADRQAIDIQIEGEELAHQQRMTEIDRAGGVASARKFELQAQQSIQSMRSPRQRRIPERAEEPVGRVEVLPAIDAHLDQQHDRAHLREASIRRRKQRRRDSGRHPRQDHGQLRRRVRERRNDRRQGSGASSAKTVPNSRSAVRTAQP
jgi:hypothetical protein